MRKSSLAFLTCLTFLQAVNATSQPRLTREQQAAGFYYIFDGHTFAGWRGLGYDSVPSAHWKIVNGTIMKVTSGNVAKMPDGQPASGGDLMTIATYGNFELLFEWKVLAGSNSGVKYNVSEEMSMKSSNHAALGFEYQVLDDSLNEDNKIPSHRAGSLYDLIAAPQSKVLKPVGSWNTARIIFVGMHGEHWLNGVKTADFDLGTPRMDSLLAKSKYRSIAGFGDRRVGHIVLQDHNETAYYRNIRIRVLK